MTSSEIAWLRREGLEFHQSYDRIRIEAECERLNRRVADAISRVEMLERGSGQERDVFHELSVLEEDIASLVGAGEVEGASARLAAVDAALRAAEPLRALLLAERFQAEQVTAELAQKLHALSEQAEAALLGSEEPRVEPIGFGVRAA